MLLALSASSEVILELLPGLTPGQLVMLQANKIITSKQQEFKDRFLGENAGEQFQRFMPRVFDTFAEGINDTSLKIEKRIQIAEWIAEKVTGKARQELELSGGVTLLSFIQGIDKLREEQAAPLSLKGKGHDGVRDVTPKADPLAAWVAENVTQN